MGTKYALVTNSGTASLHMGRLPPASAPVTMSSTAHLLVVPRRSHHNASVFVDIDPLTYTMDPALIQGIIEHTKAILPVHIHGMVADMDSISHAEKHGLLIIGTPARLMAPLLVSRRAHSGDIGCLR